MRRSRFGVSGLISQDSEAMRRSRFGVSGYLKNRGPELMTKKSFGKTKKVP